MTDILFGNNNRPVLKLLAKRSLKAQKNTIAVLAIMLATLLFTSLFTIAISLQTAMQESNMRTTGTSAHAGIKRLSWEEYEKLSSDTGIKDIGYRRVHETPSGNQTDFLYCDQSRNGLTLSTFRDSTLKNMPAGQWRCIIGQTDTLLSVSSRTAGAPRCFSLKSGAIITTPQCKRGCLRAMTYRQADTPLPSKSERSERRRQ